MDGSTLVPLLIKQAEVIERLVHVIDSLLPAPGRMHFYWKVE